MKWISLALTLTAWSLSATDSAEAGHAVGCGCAVCRQQAVVQQLYSTYVTPPAYYYQVGEQLREDAVAARVAQLTVDALKEPLAQRTAELVAEKLKGMQPVTPPPKTEPPKTEPAVPVGTDLTGKVQAILNRSCVQCHSATTLNKQPFLNDIAKTTPPNPWKLWGMAHAGTMPKKTPGQSEEDFQKALLTDAEVDTLRDWVLQLDP